MASSQLLLAQEKLRQLRAEAAKQKQNDLPWETEIRHESSISIADLPNHLGWGSTAVSQAIRYARAKKEKPLNQKINFEDIGCVMRDTCSVNNHASRITHHPKTDFVTHYPSLGIAALQQSDVPCYRVWLMCRYLDDVGRGMVEVNKLKDELTGVDAALRLFSWKRLRQTLYAGNGRFWHWNQENNQLWLVGVAKVAVALNVPKLVGKRVQLPVKTITAGISQFKAHLYAAWHSGRHSENPISREVQRQLIQIPERTQRRYGRIAKIKTTKNFAIGAHLSPEKLEQEAWQRGNAVFEFTDHAGKFGAENGRYLAWQLPNQYEGPHQQAQFGRQRKINKQLRQQQEQQLKDLVEIGAQGNRGKANVEHTYHPNGSKAVQAIRTRSEAYWPTRRSQNVRFWAVIQG